MFLWLTMTYDSSFGASKTLFWAPDAWVLTHSQFKAHRYTQMHIILEKFEVRKFEIYSSPCQAAPALLPKAS